jgi:hypothetical protein
MKELYYVPILGTSSRERLPATTKFENLSPPAKRLDSFRTPGFQHVVERAVVHEYFAVRFLLNLAVFVGGIEKLLDVLKSQETLCDSLRMERGPKRSTRFA